MLWSSLSHNRCTFTAPVKTIELGIVRPSVLRPIDVATVRHTFLHWSYCVRFRLKSIEYKFQASINEQRLRCQPAPADESWVGLWRSAEDRTCVSRLLHRLSSHQSFLICMGQKHRLVAEGRALTSTAGRVQIRDPSSLTFLGLAVPLCLRPLLEV